MEASKLQIHIESRWLCGNTLASDVNGTGSTPGGTLELDTGFHSFRVSVKCVAISKQWVTAAEDCKCKLPGVAL